MGHLKTIFLKILFSNLPIFLILTFVGKLNWLTAITVGLVLTIISYIIGDVLILPLADNLAAVIPL